MRLEGEDRRPRVARGTFAQLNGFPSRSVSSGNSRPVSRSCIVEREIKRLVKPSEYISLQNRSSVLGPSKRSTSSRRQSTISRATDSVTSGS